MNAVFVLAILTVKEAVRRRFIVAGLLISAAFLILAYIPIHPRRLEFLSPKEADELIAALISTFGGQIAEFFGFLFSIALAAGAISGELDRGILNVIVPKPIPRWSIYCGKWLGVNLMVLPFMILWVTLLQWAIYRHLHHVVPELWGAIGTMMLYPIVFSSLTLCFSTFTSTMLATILPIMMAAISWSEGILKFFAYSFDVETLKIAAKVVVYVAPTNPLSRWMEKSLHQTILQEMPRRTPGPVDPPANWIDLAWILGYALTTFLVGLVIFERRDLT